jgi:predicted RNA-binding Zn ribbon-like protein
VAGCREVAEGDARALNAALHRLQADSIVMPVHKQAPWKWVPNDSGAERLIGRIVRSAVEVLQSEDINRVKRCAAETCCWLFLDHSRGGNRRWCEMRTCGSRQKARAYYQRKTAGKRSRTPSPKNT